MSLSFLKFDGIGRLRDLMITDPPVARLGKVAGRRRLGYVLPVPAASVVLALVVASPAATQQPAPDTTGQHIVRPGDTLWDLARRYLNDPFRWPEIFSLNRNVVRDPHWIYPSDRLLIPGRTGAIVSSEMTLPRFAGLESRTVFYEPETAAPDPRTVRMAPAEQVAPVESGAFYGAGLLIPDEALGRVGELVEVVSPTVVPRRGTPQIHPFDQVLMRVDGSVQVGDRLQLFRPGRLIPPYGRVFVSTGRARVLSVAGGTATLEIVGLYDRIELGDLAVPLPTFEPRLGVRPQQGGGLAGTLLAITSGQPVVATSDMGFVDLGAASGVVEGDEFVAYLPAEAASWGVRPEVEVARLQVVRTGPTTSAVRVVSLAQPALREGMPVRLVARMPAAN